MGDVSAPTRDRAEARLGQLLSGKWRLDALLGTGGMASVYSATHRNGSRVAIKMLHRELSTDAQIRARFLREGYVANTVGHMGVVRILDDDQADDGCIYLVMELLEGESLDVMVEKLGGRMEASSVLPIAAQLLDVLDAAHAKGIVHRDIKPANVFVTTDGEVRVFDFGIARMRAPMGPSATATGAMMGTPAFMAPEQAIGATKDVDGRTDLWAVGATMFTLLTGALVHPSKSGALNETLIAAATKQARSIGAVMQELPPAVVEVVDRALAFDREKRFQSAAEMVEAIRNIYLSMFGHSISLPAESGRRVFSSIADFPTLVGDSGKDFRAALTPQDLVPQLPRDERSARTGSSPDFGHQPVLSTHSPLSSNSRRRAVKRGNRRFFMTTVVAATLTGSVLAGVFYSFIIPPRDEGSSALTDGSDATGEARATSGLSESAVAAEEPEPSASSAGQPSATAVPSASASATAPPLVVAPPAPLVRPEPWRPPPRPVPPKPAAPAPPTNKPGDWLDSPD